jgi:methyltransferase-like protein/2-polyprenyl-3-methyl-5-hydroxy-6-metoxy-1,4-benzoquinol methylase
MSGTNLCERNEAGLAEAHGTGEPTANSYDAVPYNSHPFPRTHPGHLAAVATLFGMKPAPIDCCRVLELGCAGGGNLIPMALTLPASRFVGVDLSARQIADGQKLVGELALDNIDLRHLNILDVGRGLGPFDYIVCHGVYSWAPGPVRDKILEICARGLAPQGVAFVSYNTYPGWHMNGMIRDMLCFHARRFARPEDRATQARALLDFLAEAAAPEQNAYSRLLTEGLEVFGKVDDSYLLHEYLEDVNEPVYFHQFVERAAGHGLQYLAEAEVHTMAPWRFPDKVAAAVARLSSNCIELEQFLDFVRNRKFRQTLLCHADVALERKVGPERLTDLYVASALRPESPDLDVRSNREDRFRSPRGHGPTTTDPLLKAALVHLAEHWPQAVPFTALAGAARAGLGAGGAQGPFGRADDEQTLGKSLLQLYSANMVELHARPLPFAREVAERPLASPLARRQAVAGPVVTNLRHESVSVSAWQRQALCLLDGSRNRAALLDQLPAPDPSTAPNEGQPSPSPGAALEQCLADFAGKAFFLCSPGRPAQ